MRQSTVRVPAHPLTFVKFAGLWLTVAVVALASSPLLAAAPEPQFLRQKLDAALSTPASVQFQTESRTILSTGPYAERRMVQRQLGHFVHSGDNWKFALARSVYGWDHSKSPNHLYHEFIVADRALSASLEGIHTPQDELASLLRSPDNFQGKFDVSCRLQATAEDLAWLQGSMKGSEFLFGHLACDTARLPNVLALCELSVKPEQENVDGHLTWVLEGRSPKYGHYTAWIDAEANYLPRRIVIDKAGHNLVGGKPLDEEEPYIDADDPAPDSKITAVEFRVENIRIEQIDGVDCLTAFDINTVSTYETGSPFFHSAECRLSNFQPNPQLTAANFKFTMPIPEGTKVSMGDETEGEWVWQGGDVKRAAMTKIATAENAKSPIQVRSSSPIAAIICMPRTSQLLGNLAAMFLAVAGISIERTKRQR